MIDQANAQDRTTRSGILAIVLAFLAAPALSIAYGYHFSHFVRSFMAGRDPNNPLGMMALFAIIDQFLPYQYAYLGLSAITSLIAAYLTASNVKLKAKFGIGSIIGGLLLGAISFVIAYLVIIYGFGMSIRAK